MKRKHVLNTLNGLVASSRLLIFNKNEKKESKNKNDIRKPFSMFFLVAIVLIHAISFPQNKIIETTGEFRVSTASYTYTDDNRIETYKSTGEKRKLNVSFWYPENAVGTYHLIVYSHGGTGIKTSNETLFNELASHGYVVCSIDHTYQALFTTDVDGNTTLIDWGYMQELGREDSHTNKEQSYEYYQKWMEIRTGDINFVIDLILTKVKNNNAELVYRLINPEKIGVMGHSLGGSAALGVGRIREDVSAVVALESPFLYDIRGVENNEFIFIDEPYPVPVLNVYSDSSWSHLSEWPQYAENYALLSDTDAHTIDVHVQGVGHFSLTDLALSNPFLTRILNNQKSGIDAKYCLMTINRLTLEFFDRYLI